MRWTVRGQPLSELTVSFLSDSPDTGLVQRTKKLPTCVNRWGALAVAEGFEPYDDRYIEAAQSATNSVDVPIYRTSHIVVYCQRTT